MNRRSIFASLLAIPAAIIASGSVPEFRHPPRSLWPKSPKRYGMGLTMGVDIQDGYLETGTMTWQRNYFGGVDYFHGEIRRAAAARLLDPHIITG